jgi:hypothetical protein
MLAKKGVVASSRLPSRIQALLLEVDLQMLEEEPVMDSSQKVDQFDHHFLPFDVD